MKYAITEEQFLIYHYGEAKGREILDKDLPDHYRTAYQKLQNGENLGWNWAAFFFGSLWFIYQGMSVVFFAFFISTLIITIITSITIETERLILVIFGGGSSLILLGIIAGALSDKLLLNRLSKKLKNGYFTDLHPNTQTKFIETIGVTEEQYLTFVYGEEKAQTLIKYNIPNHYREAFKKFAFGKQLFWNWSVALWSSGWFLYRGMPQISILFILLGALISLCEFIFFSDVILEDSSFASLIELMSIVFVAVSGLVGDRLLLKYISKQIKQNNFPALEKGGVIKWLIALTFVSSIPIVVIFTEILQTMSTNQSRWYLLLDLLGFTVSTIALIYTKKRIRSYKKSINPE